MNNPGPEPTLRRENAPSTERSTDDALPNAGPESRMPRLYLLFGVGVLGAAVVGLYTLAASKTNHVALASVPKPVSVVPAKATTFRPLRNYVGTSAAWNQANIGPQYVSAYVGAVLVRPGAAVKRGQVLATLDCRNASAASREIAARARALQERQAAAEHETARLSEMKQGGFASENEVEQLGARAASEAAEVQSLKAALASRSLEVDDCILRAPFDGEISERYVDTGAYVRPGNPVVTVVDRSTVRLVADAPESDFDIVSTGTPVGIRIDSVGAHFDGTVSRRSPAADETTRTVHFEIDVPNAAHKLPVGATARLTIEVGEPKPATEVPLRAATLRGEKATLFTVADNTAHRQSVAVLGERGGSLYLDGKLAPGAPVVVEGRSLLDDGDKVSTKELAK
jgi:RND family efflux transporter MFP subunit